MPTLTDIIELWKSITPKTEPSITFPKADSFKRLIDLLSVLYKKGLTREEVTINYAFEPDRQITIFQLANTLV